MQKRTIPTSEEGGTIRDETSSQRLLTIQDCIDFIDLVEANKKGTNEEKHLSEFEKYKLGANFMRMVQNPKRFDHLERFISGRSDSKLKLNLPSQDMREFTELQKHIEESNKTMEVLN